MATIDSNGLVLWETTDSVSPLQALINGATTSVSNALNTNARIFRVANSTGQSALLTSRGATASNPLLTYRTDTGNIEINDGSSWQLIYTPSASTSVAATAGTGFTGSISAYKSQDNIVTLTGALGGTPTAGSPVGSGFAALTLPFGYRPAGNMKFLTGSSSAANNNVRLVGISPGGVVTVIWSGVFSGAQGAGGSGLFMDGITFKAA